MVDERSYYGHIPVRSGFLFLAVLIGTGCDYPNRLANLEKQNRALQEEVNKRQTSTDYDLQVKCSRDAKEWFKENWSSDKDTILLDYHNHYNKNNNKCFILVEYHFSFGRGGSWINSISLWDVYENSKYGDFAEDHEIDLQLKSGTEDRVTSCNVLNRKCQTLGEFQNLTRSYLSD